MNECLVVSPYSETVQLVVDVATILSVGVTVYVLPLAIRVVSKYWKQALTEYTESDEPTTIKSIRLAKGITVGFISVILDHGYWGIAWMFHVLGSPIGAMLIFYGGFLNLFSRNLPTVVAAREHAIAANFKESGLKIQNESKLVYTAVLFTILLLTCYFHINY